MIDRDSLIKSLENVLSGIYQSESHQITHNFAARTVLKFIEDVQEESKNVQIATN